MSFVTLKRVLKMSLTSFWRNNWLSLTGTLVMTITLVIISIFTILSMTVNRTAKLLEDKINIVIYYKDETSDDQIASMQQLLKSRPDVDTIVYVSKEEAQKRFNDINHIGSDLSSIFSDNENPLPRSIEIKPKQASGAEALSNYLKDPGFAPLIRRISYDENKTVIDRLLKLTSFFTQTGLIMSLVFVVISILIIFNTIKLTIFSRKAEIEIMRLVGATDIFVKFPFIVEGMLYGILATIVSSVLLYFGYVLITPVLNNYLSGVDVGLAAFIGGNLSLIIIGQLVVGLALGAGCSYLATRRYVN